MSRLIKRYELLIVTLAVAVLLVRIGGGGFTGGDAVEPSRTEVAAVADRKADNTVNAAPELLPSSPEATGPQQVVGFAPTSLDPSQERSPSVGGGSVPGPRYADGGSFGYAFALARVPRPGAPSGITVGPRGDVWVSTNNGGGRGADGKPRIFHFAANGSLTRTITPRGADGGITALAIGPDQRLYALSTSPAAVLTVNQTTGATATYALIPDVPPCIADVIAGPCDGSVIDQPPLPSALAFDSIGRLYVADSAQGAIWRVPSASQPATQWVVDRTWTNPSRTSGPTGLAFDGAGNLVVSVASLLTEDTGVIYLQQVNPNGSPGQRTELARTGASSQPSGLALGASGRVYVTLAGTGRVLVLSPKGETIGSTPGTGRQGLDTPIGIHFRGRSVLVASQAPADPAAGRIVRLPVGELGERR